MGTILALVPQQLQGGFRKPVFVGASPTRGSSLRSPSFGYPNAPELLILADSGGSNGARCRAWKLALQEKLVDAYQLGVTVCHYPTGTSKWNPVEHRPFSELSKN